MSTTVKELNELAKSNKTSLDEIQATLQKDLKKGPAAAQVARMIAFGCAKKAAEIQGEIDQGLALISQAEPTEANPNPPIVVNKAVVDALVKQFGMDTTAIPTFMFQMNGTMMAVVEVLVDAAQEKLAEAEQIQA